MVGGGGCDPVVVVDVDVGGSSGGEGGEMITRARKEEGEGGETGVAKKDGLITALGSQALNRV